jgi:hypothetical protein
VNPTLARITVELINGCPITLAASDLETREDLTTSTEIVVSRTDKRRMARLRADVDEAVTVVDLLTDRPIRVCRLDAASTWRPITPGCIAPENSPVVGLGHGVVAPRRGWRLLVERHPRRRARLVFYPRTLTRRPRPMGRPGPHPPP